MLLVELRLGGVDKVVISYLFVYLGVIVTILKETIDEEGRMSVGLLFLKHVHSFSL